MKADKNIKKKKVSSSFLLTLLMIALVLAIPQIIDSGNPVNGAITENSSVELNFNITEANLKEVKFHWNNTNFTIYDTDNLVLAYNFNNLSTLAENDTHVFDISGTGNNGTVVGEDNITWSSTERGGNYDGTFNFSGDTSYIDGGNNESLNISDGDFTVSVWFKTDAISGTGEDQQFIVLKGDVDAGGKRLGILLDTNLLIGTIDDNTAAKSIIGDSELNDGIWHMATMVRSGNNLRLYVDSIEQSNSPVDITGYGNLDSINNGFRIGSSVKVDDSLARFFNGSVDEVNFWNVSKNSSEIQQLYYSNLNKINIDSWSLYINQSNITAGATGSLDYDYFSCATNSSNDENCTSSRTITKIPPSVINTANFTSLVGDIRNDFYGVNTLIEHLNDSNSDSQELFIDSGMNFIRSDMFFNFFSISEGNYDPVRMKESTDLVSWAKLNNVRIIWIADYMPLWLANTTEGWCEGTDNSTCPPSNHTKWGTLVTDFLKNVSCDSDTCEVEVWNEPDWSGFWMSDVISLSNLNRSIEYNKLYNATYIAVKSDYPNMRVGGVAASKVGTFAKDLLYPWMSNFSNQIDFVSVHDYLGNDDSSFDNYHQTLEQVYSWLYANMSFYNVNTSLIYLNEFNVWDDNVRANLSNEWTQQLAQVYEVTLNSYPQNISLLEYRFRSNFFNNFQMINLSNNHVFASYNITKNFATFHSAGSTVYNSSSTDSTIKTVSTKKGNDYFITIINTDTEARNITVNTNGLLTKLINQETGEEFNSPTGEFEVGVLDSFGILYLGYDSNSVDGLVARLRLNEGSGIIAYDISGFGNNGTITGSIWDNDAINIILTELVDYILSPTTGLFTIINTNFQWSELTANWGYSQIATSANNIKNNITGATSTFFTNTSTVYAILAIIVILLAIFIVVRIVSSTQVSRNKDGEFEQNNVSGI